MDLLKEYEEKILKSILDKVLVEDNFIKYTIVFFDDPLRRRVSIKLKINDREIHETFSAELILDSLLEKIINWISSQFSKIVISDLCEKFLSRSNMGYNIYVGNEK